MTEHELRAALAERGSIYDYDELGRKIDPKLKAQLEQDLNNVVGLAGHAGWKKLHATFTEYREALVQAMLATSTPDAKLPTLRAKVALLDELLGWPAAFKVAAEEILTLPKD